jgi:hypothetical protein
VNYLNLLVSDLGAEPFLLGSNEQVGVWVHLMRYCAIQENGGEILKCSVWTDAHWQRVCGSTTAMMKSPSLLWNWNGDCLRVYAYPHDQENKLRRQREMGRKWAEKRWEKMVDERERSRSARKIAKLKVIDGKAQNGTS